MIISNMNRFGNILCVVSATQRQFWIRMGRWPPVWNLFRFLVTTPTTPRVILMRLEDLFCEVDEFCQVSLPAWHRQLLTDGTRQRRQASRLTLSEIRTILI